MHKRGHISWGQIDQWQKAKTEQQRDGQEERFKDIRISLNPWANLTLGVLSANPSAIMSLILDQFGEGTARGL